MTAPPILEQTLKEAARVEALARLRKIEGQVRGLAGMVEAERYCVELLTQISSIQEALRGVGKVIMQNYLEHCATTAIRKGGRQAEEAYREILDLMYKYVR